MMRIRLIAALTACLLLPAACDENGGFKPRPGLSGAVSLENQSDHSGVMVKIEALGLFALTDSSGAFSFGEAPDGRWSLEASYPYFETVVKEVEVRDGLQRNSARFRLRQLLGFRVELPDTVVSFCKCEANLFGFPINGYVTNLTDDRVTVSCGSTPLPDYALIPQTRRSEGALTRPLDSDRETGAAPVGRPLGGLLSDTCSEDGMLLPGELDMPGSVTLEPLETRLFRLTARLQSECHEHGRYEVFWALVDCSNHPEHYVFDEPDLNRTLLRKPDLLKPASIRFMETSAD
jgi:hypothetical protein